MHQTQFKILGVPLTIWDKKYQLNWIEKRLEKGNQSYIVGVDLHKLVHSLRDYNLQEELRKADVTFLEGIALSLAARIFGVTGARGIIEKIFIPELFQIAKRYGLHIIILCERESEIPELKKSLSTLYQENDITVTTYDSYLESKDTLSGKNKENKSIMLLGEVSNPDREFILKNSIDDPNVKIAHGFGLTYDLINNRNNGNRAGTSNYTLRKSFQKPPLQWVKHSYTILEFLLLLTVEILEETIIPYELLALESDRGHDLYRLGKRLLDIIFSISILILGSPVYITIAILIKLDSKGDIFFRQKRTGYKGKEFTILKFRTMRNNVPKYDHSPNCANDKRLTRIGRYLRKTSLDEIPQFINVLKSDMSIVGPRPEMPFKVKSYNGKERMRLSVKPGVTGPWQLYGDRSIPIHKALEHDIKYIENRSMWFDLKIIILSFVHILLTPLKSEKEWKQW